MNKNMIKDKIYVVMYNPMIHDDGGFKIISLHRTRKGAEMAMEFHKAKCKKEWEKEMFKYGEFEAWDVIEYEIME